MDFFEFYLPSLEEYNELKTAVMTNPNLQLHPNFKSPCHPAENMDELMTFFNIDDSCNMLFIHGYHQYGKDNFLNKMSQFKMDSWNELASCDFKIDYEKIDRLYNYDVGFDDGDSTMVYFRMDHKGRGVYVQAELLYEMPDVIVYATYNPEKFLVDVVEWQPNTIKIWKSIVEDGHAVKKPKPPAHLGLAHKYKEDKEPEIKMEKTKNKLKVKKTEKNENKQKVKKTEKNENAQKIDSQQICQQVSEEQPPLNPIMASPKLQLHPNFKSPCYPVQNTDDLVDFFKTDDLSNMHCVSGYRYYSKDDFLNRMSQFTRYWWNVLSTDDFKIDYEKIDRFYDYNRGVGNEASTTVLFRMDHEGREIYVQVELIYEIPKVELYVTYNPENFLDTVVEWRDNTIKIWQSLVEDGHAIKKPQPPLHLTQEYKDDVKTKNP